jgi:hypothetical protein
MQLLPQSVVIASRVLSFEWPDGASLDVAVEVYRPEEVDARSWACTFVVRGFESDIVRPIFGIDSMQALVLSLHVIPTELQAIARRTGGRFVTAADLGLDGACSVHLGKG